MKRKICVVVTARPSYSRIKTVLNGIKNNENLELQLVLTASSLLDRYGSVINQIQEDGFTIASKVFMVLEGENPTTMAKTTGIGVLELSTVLDNLKPDIVVTVADRYETIATAIAAAYMNIPLAHIQGGEITGSIDEKVRHSITKLSDLHFVSNRFAGERVIKMGEDPETVFVTGCPSIDIALNIVNESKLDFNPFERYKGVGPMPDISNGYIVVMQHPVTTEFQRAKDQILETLTAVHQSNLPVLWFWPNVDAGSDGTSKGIRYFRETEKTEKIHFFKNMSPTDFLILLKNSRCLIGNSSVGIRECSFLGIPVVDIGSRQSGRDKGKNVIGCDYKKEEILSCLEKQIAHGHYESDNLYGDGCAGEKISDILETATLKISKKLTY